MLNKIFANQLIVVKRQNDFNKAILSFYENREGRFYKVLETEAFIGKNGMTEEKREGDGKTPKGVYELGLAFGIHDRKAISIDSSIDYIKINQNLYWVDDVNSIYYNQLVDSREVKNDWKSAEHLIEYHKQYEYAIEVKNNICNVPGNGSAIFLHCSDNNPTAGCISIPKEKMEELLRKIKAGAIIFIDE